MTSPSSPRFYDSPKRVSQGIRVNVPLLWDVLVGKYSKQQQQTLFFDLCMLHWIGLQITKLF